MEQEYRNICYIGRKRQDFTQEGWAEIIGVSADTVRKYESEVIMPSDQVALRIADAADLKVLAYWHLRNKSALGAAVLPSLCRRTLAEAVLNLLTKTEDFTRGGKISAEEVVAYGEALAQLREVIAAAYELEYAEEAEQ